MIYLGCSQWNYTYLKKNKSFNRDLLNAYSLEFNCVELNSTFYELPLPDTINKWKSEVNSDFRFCPKFPGSISHEKFLICTEVDLNSFIDTVKLFGSNLGVCFLQLSPYMFKSKKTALGNFLAKLNSRIKMNVELRPEWLADPETTSYCINALKEYKAGIVLVDGADTIRYLNNLKLTTPTAFIRFLSYEHPADYRRIDDWINQIKNWLDKGVEDIYFILHFGDRNYKPGIIDYVREKFADFSA